jgi:hypothetical protein
MRSSLALAALAGWLVACADEPDELPVRFETAHFRYHAKEEAPLCSGLGDWLEHHYAAHAAWLGVELPAGQKIDYYLLENLGAADTACGTPHGVSLSGCSQEWRIYTWQTYHPHELAHAYAWSFGGSGPPTFFKEGLAVVLGGGAGEVDRSLDVAALVETQAFMQASASDFGRSYAAAGSLTRFLIERHGREAFLGFYRAAPRDGSSDAIGAAFEAAFGETLTAALEAWRAAPPEDEDDYLLHVAECAAPAIPMNVAALACNPRGSSVYPLGMVGSLSLTEPEAIVVRLRSSGVAGVRIGHCSERLQAELVALSDKHFDHDRELWTDLPAGAYFVSIAAEGPAAGPSSETAVALERTPPLLADRCEEAPARAIGPATTEVVVAGSFEGAADDAPLDGLADVSLRFRLSEPRVAASTSFNPNDIDHVTLCTASCPGDAGAACSPVGGSALTADATHALTIDGTAGEHGIRYGLQLLPE